MCWFANIAIGVTTRSRPQDCTQRLILGYEVEDILLHGNGKEYSQEEMWQMIAHAYRRHGYRVNSFDDVEEYNQKDRIFTNHHSALCAYINEYTYAWFFYHPVPSHGKIWPRWKSQILLTMKRAFYYYEGARRWGSMKVYVKVDSVFDSTGYPSEKYCLNERESIWDWKGPGLSPCRDYLWASRLLLYCCREWTGAPAVLWASGPKVFRPGRPLVCRGTGVATGPDSRNRLFCKSVAKNRRKICEISDFGEGGVSCQSRKPI